MKKITPLVGVIVLIGLVAGVFAPARIGAVTAYLTVLLMVLSLFVVP